MLKLEINIRIIGLLHQTFINALRLILTESLS